MEISKLYNSGRCKLLCVVKSGKKEVPGILHFKGLPTAVGDGTEVCAIEDGVVMYVGRCYEINSRRMKRGLVVEVLGRNGVVTCYERLAIAAVKEGEDIRAGQPIAREGNTGAGKQEYLALRFERNGRLINGLEYLGITDELGEYRCNEISAEDTVCKICGLDQHERYSLRTLPCADSIWNKVLKTLEKRFADSGRSTV